MPALTAAPSTLEHALCFMDHIGSHGLLTTVPLLGEREDGISLVPETRLFLLSLFGGHSWHHAQELLLVVLGYPAVLGKETWGSHISLVPCLIHETRSLLGTLCPVCTPRSGAGGPTPEFLSRRRVLRGWGVP